jgi:CO/xanthine dehydrogenase Mo-binding subunit
MAAETGIAQAPLKDPGGPFGAKGIGEAGLVPRAAAIANAIYNVCDVRVHQLPIAREFILNAFPLTLRERLC